MSETGVDAPLGEAGAAVSCPRNALVGSSQRLSGHRGGRVTPPRVTTCREKRWRASTLKARNTAIIPSYFPLFLQIHSRVAEFVMTVLGFGAGVFNSVGGFECHFSEPENPVM